MDETKSTVEILNDALEESFRKVEETDLGTEERREAHKERMDLLNARIEMQKVLDAEEESELKAKESKKAKNLDLSVKIFEVIITTAGKILVVAASAALSLKLYDFALGKDGFLSKDQSGAIGILQGIINKA